MSSVNTLSIGPLSLTFSFDDPAWETLLRADYGRFLKRSHTGMPITITTLKAAGAGELKVTATRRSVTIRRDDFLSRSDSRFSRTDLSILRDKYSFNSWLRVFLSIAGIRGNVVLIHGAGYHDRRGIYLFPGRSGAGKSTITRLLGKQNALSDELTMLRLDEGVATAFSTPFWGELKKGGKRHYSGRLKGIFTLRHGTGIEARPADLPAILRALLATALFFTDAPPLMRRLLRVTESIARGTPGHQLTFPKNAPKRTVLKTLREAAA